MILNKTHLIVFIVGAILGICTGFFSAKALYDQPIDAKIERDTVTRVDTVKHYVPKPYEVEKTHTEYKWLTRVQYVDKTDTLTLCDSVLVEVPIESKHYHADEYDAWVSGYEPSLDSINVYQKNEYITETVTLTKKTSRWSVGLQGGYGYGFKSKQLEPYIGFGVGFRIF